MVPSITWARKPERLEEQACELQSMQPVAGPRSCGWNKVTPKEDAAEWRMIHFSRHCLGSPPTLDVLALRTDKSVCCLCDWNTNWNVSSNISCLPGRNFLCFFLRMHLCNLARLLDGWDFKSDVSPRPSFAKLQSKAFFSKSSLNHVCVFVSQGTFNVVEQEWAGLR